MAEQGSALYWEIHDHLFDRQDEWSRLRDPREYVAELAESIGVDMEAYGACMAAGETDSLVSQRVAAGRALGFNGTPTFQVLDNVSGEIHLLSGKRKILQLHHQ